MPDIFKKIIAGSLISASFLIAEASISLAQAASDPGRVDLLVEPVSYIPPFYLGSPLFSNQGTVKITALADVVIDGQKASSNDLNFKWQKDNVVLGQDSGIGRDSLILDAGIQTGNINIGVSVLDSSGNVLASDSKTISTNNPKIIFYENSPLYGILYNRALNGGYNLGEREELRVVAKPYFFNVISDVSSDLDYAWSVNGDSVKLSGRANELLLRQTATSSSGITSVSLDINNLDRIFQSANASFNVTFGKQ